MELVEHRSLLEVAGDVGEDVSDPRDFANEPQTFGLLLPMIWRQRAQTQQRRNSSLAGDALQFTEFVFAQPESNGFVPRHKRVKGNSL